MPLEKLLTFTNDVGDLANKPNATMTAEQLKAQFDAAPNEVRVFLNKLIDDLSSVVDGDSGADNIAVTAIAGLTGATVQAVLESLKTVVDSTVLGQIPDGTITLEKLAFAIASTASDVSIVDVGNHFTSTNAEGALQELFQFANDGKTKWSTVVGSPLVSGDTFTQMQSKTQTIKNSFGSAIRAKGGTVSDTDTLEVMASAVNAMYVPKTKKGTATVASSSFAVTGLGFTPKTITIIGYVSGTTYSHVTHHVTDRSGTVRKAQTGAGASNDIITPTSDGFTVTTTYISSGNYDWLANDIGGVN